MDKSHAVHHIAVAMGCFWGVQKLFDSQPGVTTSIVGYMGGHTPHPTYEQVCTGTTGHAEAIWVEFDPAVTSCADLLRVFWENHDPTQGNRQGNDVGSQYRSVIFPADDAQSRLAAEQLASYQTSLSAAGYGTITTQIAPVGVEFWPAEEQHQKYLQKNPFGYCPVHATGVACSPAM